MAEYPILILPAPNRVSVDSGGGGKGALINTPGIRRQGDRLTPRFLQLQAAMAQRRLWLRSDQSGIQPELVLILETYGSINQFFNALARIDGLEWLGESEQRDIAPDFGFANPSKTIDTLNGQLFLVMSDQRALVQLRNLFEQWKNEGEHMDFPHGLAKLRDAFHHLREIRPWNAQDRVNGTGLIADWQFRLAHDDSSDIPVEIELWFRENRRRRELAASTVQGIFETLGGDVLQQCEIQDIRYHCILGLLPRFAVENIVSNLDNLDDVELIRCDDIMFFRPVGQFVVENPSIEDNAVVEEDDKHETDLNPQPLVAIFDGLPLENHDLIADWLIIDDPDDFEGAYLADQRVHGTTMASLICRGDRNENAPAISRKIYVRPIMQPFVDFNGGSYERVPHTVLFVDLLHRAIRRLFEPENGYPAVAPTVRVINISVCDGGRSYINDISPSARLLDWLSWKYEILIIVSAGNHQQEIQLDRAPLPGFGAYEKPVIKSIAEDTLRRRLLSPAEAMNCITVGAAHADATASTPSPLINPYLNQSLPNVISAHGPGYRRTVKPDILLPGGRQPLLNQQFGNRQNNSIFEIFRFSREPGQRVAVPGAQGQLNHTVHTRGTSNSAALASRATHFLHEAIEQLRETSQTAPGPDFDVQLLKALLVHGAGWGDAHRIFEGALETSDTVSASKENVGHYLGYGVADIDKVLTSTEQRATVIGFGSLVDGAADEFKFPIPPSLGSVAVERWLTITLAWLTPINCARQDYRAVQLWYDPPNKLAKKRTEADNRAAKRGTLQHEIFLGEEAEPFINRDFVTITVNCKAPEGEILDPIKYALAVTLEVADGVSIPIYQEIRNQLAVPVQISSVPQP